MQTHLKEISKNYGVHPDNVFSVSQITSKVKQLIQNETTLNGIYVFGEIVNLSKSASGNIYFDLKDETGSLSCVLFKGNNNLPFGLETGLSVLVLGSISTYEKKSIYQLNLSQIFPVGEGIYHLKYKELKKRLTSEGLFEISRKKSIVVIPSKVGLITSKTGHAYKDFIHVVRQRFPHVTIQIRSVKMQGEYADQAILGAIKKFNLENEVDTIVITRGGGSTEDLTCFNSENLIRAIRNSKIPIITGIGHESDISLADLAADRYSATPSLAAKETIPDKKVLLDEINKLSLQLEETYINSFKTTEVTHEINKQKAINGILIILIIILALALLLMLWVNLR